MFIRACQSLSWARCTQSTLSHFISLWFILISFHLQLHLPSGLFPSGFPTKILYTFLIYPVHSWPSHPPWFHHPNIIWWNIQVMELHIMQCNILHPPATSSLSNYCSQKPSIYILPLVWKTKYHTLTKQKKKCSWWKGFLKIQRHHIFSLYLCHFVLTRFVTRALHIVQLTEIRFNHHVHNFSAELKVVTE